MATLYDRADTAELETYAAPRRSFYGKAVIRRETACDGRLVQELYSYGICVATAGIKEYPYGSFCVFTLYKPEQRATATTRRHIRAFAEMLADNMRHMYIGEVERPTAVVEYHASANDKLTTLYEDEHNMCGLCELVEKALHAVPQARAY